MILLEEDVANDSERDNQTGTLCGCGCKFCWFTATFVHKVVISKGKAFVCVCVCVCVRLKSFLITKIMPHTNNKKQ